LHHAGKGRHPGKKLYGAAVEGAAHSLNALDCGAKLISRLLKTRPSGKQFSSLMIHFTKCHNVSAIIRLQPAPSTAGYLDEWLKKLKIYDKCENEMNPIDILKYEPH